MYFWRTDLLVEELKNNSLDESARKGYYMATAVIGLVGYYLTLFAPRSEPLPMFGQAAAALVITVLGINYAYNANGGASGNRFLEKNDCYLPPAVDKVLRSLLRAGRCYLRNGFLPRPVIW